MLPKQHGAILFTGASASVKGYAQSAPFAMGKFALRGLAQSMARELAPQGIHVAHFVIDGAHRAARAAPAGGRARLRCSTRTRSRRTTCTCCGSRAARGRGRSSCGPGSRSSEPHEPASPFSDTPLRVARRLVARRGARRQRRHRLDGEPHRRRRRGRRRRRRRADRGHRRARRRRDVDGRGRVRLGEFAGRRREAPTSRARRGAARRTRRTSCGELAEDLREARARSGAGAAVADAADGEGCARPRTRATSSASPRRTRARPVQAAIASAARFTAGAALPLAGGAALTPARCSCRSCPAASLVFLGRAGRDRRRGPAARIAGARAARDLLGRARTGDHSGNRWRDRDGDMRPSRPFLSGAIGVCWPRGHHGEGDDQERFAPVGFAAALFAGPVLAHHSYRDLRPDEGSFTSPAR